MQIEINFSYEDLRRLLAEYCRKQFKVDPRNVDIKLIHPDRKDQYIAKVEGDYHPE